MNRTVIINARVITPDQIIENGAISIVDDRICGVGPESDIQIPKDACIVDAEGNFTGPGFIDIHCHGGGGFLFNNELEKSVKAHFSHGVTGILTSFAYDLDTEQIMEGIQRVKDFIHRDRRGILLGIHMEGPYINSKYGASSFHARKFDPEEYRMFLKASEGWIKRWTFAPELEGAAEFCEILAGKGIVLSVGHSEAEPDMIYKLIPKGMKLACHCMNATGVTPSPTRFRGTREVGVDEAVLAHDDFFVEVVPDSMGYHVRPIMLNLIYKVKGADKIIIISDAVEPSGITPFHYNCVDGREAVENAADVTIDEHGDLAGTRLTMDYAVRNMMNHTGIGMCEAFKMASLNPAILLGIQDRFGSLEEGKKANIVIVDEKIHVKYVMIGGRFLI